MALTSSSPSAEPCAAPVFCLFGAGQPMMVRSTMIDGRSVSALAAAKRGVERGEVLAVVHVLDVPAVGLVALADVLGEGDVGVVLDRDLVVVVDEDEVAQLLGAGERGRLAADALLQVAVGGERPDGVVEQATRPRAASGSNRPRSRRAAMAMPTALPTPWPSGPVVVSTPGVWLTSGWPGVSEPQVRSACRSASSRP